MGNTQPEQESGQRREPRIASRTIEVKEQQEAETRVSRAQQKRERELERKKAVIFHISGMSLGAGLGELHGQFKDWIDEQVKEAQRQKTSVKRERILENIENWFAAMQKHQDWSKQLTEEAKGRFWMEFATRRYSHLVQANSQADIILVGNTMYGWPDIYNAQDDPDSAAPFVYEPELIENHLVKRWFLHEAHPELVEHAWQARLKMWKANLDKILSGQTEVHFSANDIRRQCELERDEFVDNRGYKEESSVQDIFLAVRNVLLRDVIRD